MNENEQLFLFGREHGPSRFEQKSASATQGLTVQIGNMIDVPLMFRKPQSAQ
jgi:hypothetical protein